MMTLPIEQIYNGANLLALPFWVLMIVLPNWGVTRKVMESYIPFILFASVYILLFANSLTSESAAALSNPTLSAIAQAFSDEKVAATGWIHYIVMDLFVGRWIYWQGQQTGVWTVHSLALCLFAGPMGLLSHIITAWVSQKFLNSSQDNASAVNEPS